MVGKNTRVIENLKLSELTRKYLKKKDFSECTCMQLIVEFYGEFDIDLGEEFEGYTLQTYLDYWREDRKNAYQSLKRFVENLGEEVSADRLKLLDLVILHQPAYKSNDPEDPGTLFPGIYVGREHVINSSLRGGVNLSPIGPVVNRVVMARRLCKIGRK